MWYYLDSFTNYIKTKELWLLSSQKAKIKNAYKQLGCEFKNEDECQEELDEEGMDLDEAERNHYEETDWL